MQNIKKIILILSIIIIIMHMWESIYFDSLNVDCYGICSVVSNLTDTGYGKICFTKKSDIDGIVNKMNNIRLKKRKNFNPQGSKSPLGYVKFYYTDNTVLRFEIYGDSIYESESKIWYELKTDVILYEELTDFLCSLGAGQ